MSAALIEVLDSINTNYRFNTTNTRLGKPQPQIGKFNTKVLVQGLLSAGRYSQRDFLYSRFDLSKLSSRRVYWKGEASTHQLLDKINFIPIFTYTLGYGQKAFARQGFLRPDDIIDEPISMAGGFNNEIRLKAHPDSYLYHGTLSLELHT